MSIRNIAFNSNNTDESTSDFVFLPDDEDDFDPDAVFADFDESLADELLAV